MSFHKIVVAGGGEETLTAVSTLLDDLVKKPGIDHEDAAEDRPHPGSLSQRDRCDGEGAG